MTLAQWESAFGHYVGTHKSGARWTPDSPLANRPERTELFRLSDHAVAHVGGGTVWLVPRGAWLGVSS
jgi:hypothetical protein